MKKSNCSKKNKLKTNELVKDVYNVQGECIELFNDEDVEIDEALLNSEVLEKDIKKMMKDDDVFVGNSLRMLFQEMKKYPLLSKKEEETLLKKYATGNKTEKEIAKEELIKANMRLVVYNAKRYVNYGVPLEDLIQEGFIGLSESIDKFDYNKGVKLSTYATFRIRQTISRYICNNGRAIRLPIYIIEKLNKYKNAKNKFIVENGYEPDNKTMAKILRTSEINIEKLISYSSDIISLDKTIGEDEENNIGEMVEDRSYQSPEEYTEQEALRREIDKIISTLNPREQQVIRMRYGFDDGVKKTLSFIGDKLKVTRERARQIEIVALNKLKNKAKKLVDAI